MGPRSIERLFLGIVVACAASFWGCERTPESYDYHGPQPDGVTLDKWTPADVHLDDLGVEPDTKVDTALPDIEDVTGQETDEFSPPDVIELSDLPTPSKKVRTCEYTFRFSPPDEGVPAVASALFVSSPEQPWAEAERVMELEGAGNYKLTVDISALAPGSYGYKFHTSNDGWYLDPSNPLAKFEGGFENSKIIVPDCSVPALELKSKELNAAAGTLKVVVEVLDGVGSEGVVPSTLKVSLNGAPQAAAYDAEEGTITVNLSGLKLGSKASLLMSIGNASGQSRALYVPVWVEETPWTWREATMYFTFTDRFANGDASNDNPANCDSSPKSTDWNGGDFKGLKEKVEEGYFTDLGVNALWISPVADNPNGCFSGSLAGVKYTAYHAYFPIDFYKTEEHYGTMQELKDLVNAAHDQGIRVLIDFVGNHCHTESPLWADHNADGWFHGSTPCEPAWDQPINCWFQPYLPDFDYTNDAVTEYITENAIFWIHETGIDGFRVDAVKHMVHNFTKTLRWKIEQEVVAPTGVPFYMVGETFVGDWGGGTGSEEGAIKEFIGPWELDGQFDFPFYWKLLRIAGRGESSFQDLSAFMSEALPYWGSNALMVSFIGNHDVPRFTSHAAGQIGDLWGNGSKEQGLSNPPGQPTDELPYKKLKLAMGVMMTLPEIPLIYYGDEVGLAGAGDPDNRRMMQFGNDLSPNQAAALEFVQKLGQARKELAPLRLGALKTLSVTADTWAYERTHDGSRVVVVVTRDGAGATVQIDWEVAGNLTDYITGATIPVTDGKASVQLGGFGVAVLYVL